MAGTEDRDDDKECFDVVRDRLERFERTGNASLVVAFLADDVVLLPPGGAPIEGREPVVETLGAFRRTPTSSNTQAKTSCSAVTSPAIMCP